MSSMLSTWLLASFCVARSTCLIHSYIFIFGYQKKEKEKKRKKERKEKRKTERELFFYQCRGIFSLSYLIIFIFCDVCVCVFFLFVEIQSSIFFSSSPLFLCYVKWSYLRTECTLQMKKILKIYKLNNVFLLIFNRA